VRIPVAPATRTDLKAATSSDPMLAGFRFDAGQLTCAPLGRQLILEKHEHPGRTARHVKMFDYAAGVIYNVPSEFDASMRNLASSNLKNSPGCVQRLASAP
jgi:hypothetical protein